LISGRSEFNDDTISDDDLVNVIDVVDAAMVAVVVVVVVAVDDDGLLIIFVFTISTHRIEYHSKLN